MTPEERIAELEAQVERLKLILLVEQANFEPEGWTYTYIALDDLSDPYDYRWVHNSGDLVWESGSGWAWASKGSVGVASSALEAMEAADRESNRG